MALMVSDNTLLRFFVETWSLVYFNPIKFGSIVINYSMSLRQEVTLNPYLIFVIFFTRAKFLEKKIYTEKRQFFALNL